MFTFTEIRATQQADGTWKQEPIVFQTEDVEELIDRVCERNDKLTARGYALEEISRGVVAGKLGRYAVELSVSDDNGFPATIEDLRAEREIMPLTVERVQRPAKRTCPNCGGTGQYKHFGKCYRCNGTGEEPKKKEYQLDQQPAHVVGGKPLCKGTYTIVDPRDDSYRTLRVSDGKGSFEGKIVLSYLSGPDNEASYTGFAFYNPERGSIHLWKRFAGNQQLLDQASVLIADPTSAGERYAMESGNCYRCGRTLTVPTSLHRGLGPECAKKV